MSAKPASPSKSNRAIRSDALIATAQRQIAQRFGLPPDSIRLINPDGRKARADKTVAQLCKDWGW